MFFGQVKITMDENHRIKLPADLFEKLGSRLVVTPGFDNHLFFFPEDVFTILATRLNTLNLMDPLTRTLKRYLLGNAAICDLDESGIFTFPRMMREYFGTDSQIILVGQGSYLEAWTPLQWMEESKKMNNSTANPFLFSGINLAGM